MTQTVPPIQYETFLSHRGWSDVIAALESEPCSAYILRPDLSLLYVNRAWSHFARGNDAPWLADEWRASGPILTSMSQALQQFFLPRLSAALARNRAWSHTYECSSPVTYRRFHMRAQAGPGQEALVVVHSLVAESRLPDRAPQSLVREFTDARGLIVRCAACGRTRRPGNADSWEWAPSLDREPNISTGICGVCSVHEYGLPLLGRQVQ